jgi:hypothetical protein
LFTPEKLAKAEPFYARNLHHVNHLLGGEWWVERPTDLNPEGSASRSPTYEDGPAMEEAFRKAEAKEQAQQRAALEAVAAPLLGPQTMEALRRIQGVKDPRARVQEAFALGKKIAPDLFGGDEAPADTSAFHKLIAEKMLEMGSRLRTGQAVKPIKKNEDEE